MLLVGFRFLLPVFARVFRERGDRSRNTGCHMITERHVLSHQVLHLLSKNHFFAFFLSPANVEVMLTILVSHAS